MTNSEIRRLAGELRVARALAITFPNNQKLRIEYEQLLVRFTLARESQLEDIS